MSVLQPRCTKRTASLVLLALALVGCTNDELELQVTRYKWLVSGEAITAPDATRLVGAPAGSQVTVDDCEISYVATQGEGLDTIDEQLRRARAEIDTEDNFWVGHITSPSEVFISYALRRSENSFSFGLASSGSEFAGSGRTPRADLAMALETNSADLIFAMVRRRMDVSGAGRRCLARAAQRLCPASSAHRVSYVSSMLYGAMIRLSSSKIAVDASAEGGSGPIRVNVTSNFSVEDMTGGWIGGIRTGPEIADRLEENELDIAEVAGRVQRGEWMRLVRDFDPMVDRYGVIAVELETVDCATEGTASDAP